MTRNKTHECLGFQEALPSKMREMKKKLLFRRLSVLPPLTLMLFSVQIKLIQLLSLIKGKEIIRRFD